MSDQQSTRGPTAAPDEQPSSGGSGTPKKSGGGGGAFGWLTGFFSPAPKDRAPRNDREAKRLVDKRKRTLKHGVRYGGDRMKWFFLQGGMAVLVLFSIFAIIVANGKASPDEIDKAVEKALVEQGRDFPKGQAVMWAGQVVRVWGTWNEDDDETRKVLIAPFLSAGMDEQAGWNGRGQQSVIFASVNPEPIAVDANRAIVQATYQIQDGSWRCVSIPVFGYKPKEFTGADAPWAFSLSGNPVPSACTPRTGAPTLPDASAEYLNMATDDELSTQLARDFFPGFFSAWAASDDDALTQYTDSGVTTMGLGGAMQSVPSPTIGDTEVYIDKNGAKENKVYQAVTTVTWTVAGSNAQVDATYVVPMIKHGDRWFVAGEPAPTPQDPSISSGSPGTVPEPGDDVEDGSGKYPDSQGEPSDPPGSVDTSTGDEEKATPPKGNKGKKNRQGNKGDRDGSGTNEGGE